MRYKFRGKRVDTGEWVVGGFHEHIKRQPCPVGDELSNDDVCSLIIQTGFADWNMPRPILAFEVMPESVGQFTGLLDKNGVEIYEDDVVEAWDRGLTAKGVVQRRVDGMYYMHPAKQHGRTWGLDPMYNGKTKAIIIGNVVDNPELMEVE